LGFIFLYTHRTTMVTKFINTRLYLRVLSSYRAFTCSSSQSIIIHTLFGVDNRLLCVAVV